MDNSGRSPNGAALSPTVEPVVSTPDGASIANAGPRFGIDIPEEMTWQYRQLLRGGYWTHTWVLHGKKGAIHIDAFLSVNLRGHHGDWLGGIECHTPCEEGEANHKHCWVLGGPCKHDGSSLQFAEQLAPIMPYSLGEKPNEMDASVHRSVTYVMLDRYGLWLENEQ